MHRIVEHVPVGEAIPIVGPQGVIVLDSALGCFFVAIVCMQELGDFVFCKAKKRLKKQKTKKRPI